ncbi:probable N-acetyltransferase camello [Protopterus annectens]|uniref:probable N-acetyltransferase camello n=1 Tax=Protopterus annectens TaxID=7888 RepID=UPI001CFB5FCB|nr:probable N-acetyltransferase camello [Protopterus annectens]
MKDYCIRKYNDSDYNNVRDIFANGMREHIPAAYKEALKHPRNVLMFTLFFCLLFIISKSFILVITAVTLLLVFIQQGASYLYTSYIQMVLMSDLLDIRKVYMDSERSCFWVAECYGNIIATAAAAPTEIESEVELKRLSVRRAFRGRGIAKALCRTVIGFAKQKGYKSVILEVSFPQYDACKLYNGLGFVKAEEFIFPTALGKLCQLKVMKYRYNIPSNSG